ncbi:hypothetical protein [Arthrobacter sp. MAHUQ-56]
MTHNNPYREAWRAAVLADGALSTETRSVATVLADAARLGSVAMTDYRKLNRELGRPPGNKGVFSQIVELRAAGWIGPFRSTVSGWDNGWPLTFPWDDQE